MPPQQKGKAPTKGAKQILAENTATVYFYRNISLVASVVYHTINIAMWFQQITTSLILLNLIVSTLYVGSHHLMLILSTPRYSLSGHLENPGMDLNVEGGIAEHIKDVVILTAITHLLTLTSDYFWYMLLLVPIRFAYLIWVNFLGPWFFEKPPEDTEQDEKKRKKLERKMKRFQQQ